MRLSVVRTGTATVRTGMLGRYLATSRAVLPPRVSTTIRLACTCGTSDDHEFGSCWMLEGHVFYIWQRASGCRQTSVEEGL